MLDTRNINSIAQVLCHRITGIRDITAIRDITKTRVGPPEVMYLESPRKSLVSRNPHVSRGFGKVTIQSFKAEKTKTRNI